MNNWREDIAAEPTEEQLISKRPFTETHLPTDEGGNDNLKSLEFGRWVDRGVNKPYEVNGKEYPWHCVSMPLVHPYLTLLGHKEFYESMAFLIILVDDDSYF